MKLKKIVIGAMLLLVLGILIGCGAEEVQELPTVEQNEQVEEVQEPVVEEPVVEEPVVEEDEDYKDLQSADDNFDAIEAALDDLASK